MVRPNALGGLAVDQQFKFRGLLDGKFAQLGAFKYLVDENGGTAVLFTRCSPSRIFPIGPAVCQRSTRGLGSAGVT